MSRRYGFVLLMFSAYCFGFGWLVRRGEVEEGGGGRRPTAVPVVVPLPERPDAPMPGVSPCPGPLNTKETSEDHCHDHVNKKCAAEIENNQA
jgi:hypothetical protein